VLAAATVMAISGKTVTRACAGAIERRFKPFLPRNKKQAAAW
jgi:hypothetical protein